MPIIADTLNEKASSIDAWINVGASNIYVNLVFDVTNRDVKIIDCQHRGYNLVDVMSDNETWGDLEEEIEQLLAADKYEGSQSFDVNERR